MCILLSPGHGSEEDEHQALSDKEVILVTLNLKGEFHLANLVLDYSATVYRSALGFIIPYRTEKWLLLRRTYRSDFVLAQTSQSHLTFFFLTLQIIFLCDDTIFCFHFRKFGICDC